MIVRNGWLAGFVVAGALAGCSDDVRPGAPAGDGGLVLTTPDLGTIMLSDTGSLPDLVIANDGPPPDFGPLVDVVPVDRPVVPIDAGDAGPAPDGATPDRPVLTDTGPDAGRNLRTFCRFSSTQMAALAVRAATCLNEPPQRVVEQMFRPSTWEGGLITSRPCSILNAALSNNGGCTGFLLDSLKIAVEPSPGGTCTAPVIGCRTPAPGHETATTCRNGLIISEECQYVTGTTECLSSAGAVGCRPQPSETAACTEAMPARCFNGRLQRCVGGAYVHTLDCDTSLTTCDATANACVGGGAACTGDVDRCDGTRIQQCRGGRLHSNDCSFLVPGSTCRTVGGHSFCGTGSECDPASSPAGGTCEGNVLRLCVGGVIQSINCVTAGFVGCGVGGCTH